MAVVTGVWKICRADERHSGRSIHEWHPLVKRVVNLRDATASWDCGMAIMRNCADRSFGYRGA